MSLKINKIFKFLLFLVGAYLFIKLNTYIDLKSSHIPNIKY